MNKKILIGLTVILVLVFAVPAFAEFTGLTDAQKTKINNIQKQITELRKQQIDEYVKAGQITADQGKVIKENMDKAEKYREENGITPGFGGGRRGNGGFGGPGMGGGCGMRGGFGGGFNGGAAQNTSI